MPTSSSDTSEGERAHHPASSAQRQPATRVEAAQTPPSRTAAALKPKPAAATKAGGGGGGARGSERRFREAWRRTAGDASEGEQRRAVVQAIQVFQQLPAGSQYARHRLRVLRKALELLDKQA